ncbi:hypothetical protein ABW21_db0204285 [Orbilia brochopaga]|nr:hypothetical protein ABW21_db0204285 [Drechslerella brochopaga]
MWSKLQSLASLLLVHSLAPAIGVYARPSPPPPGKPFLIKIDANNAIIGNDLWNLTVGPQFATKLYYKGVDLVGDAVGHYVSYNGAANNLVLINAEIYKETGEYTDIVFHATEGDFHWVLTPTLLGAYQYFVNKALPNLGEFRTLWRLANDSFTYGKSRERNELLPPLSDILSSTKVQDETWQRADGSFITKYDFASFMPVVQDEPDIWGVYGPLGGSTAPGAEQIGSWYLHAGVDYINGDHLKQELTIHRESATGDTVQLNMIHGTHFQTTSDDAFQVGKTWGPWLWYMNDGSLDDAQKRMKAEAKLWPYEWFQDSNGFHSRGSVSGRIVNEDGQGANHAAVFLGDNHSTKSTLDQGAAYYYRTYADHAGYFTFKNVRQGTYGLRAFPNGDRTLSDVSTTFSKDDVSAVADETIDVGTMTWPTQGRQIIWQIGDLDRLATGFAWAGPPHEHARSAHCPANLIYTVGESTDEDWCFVQWDLGTWSIVFDIPNRWKNKGSAILTLALSAYASGVSGNVFANNEKIGNLTSGILPTSASIYRSATLAGEFSQWQFPIAAGKLAPGTNTISINVTRSQQWHGWMYDSLILEWV